ncbi:restriction endonuclease subunit S [Moraxella bovoculi]|uniref:restriction endonuclease subunit S n=1 Tax=Moraxella bovoculi TaxID=386891 RepID=UPI00062452E1|nr:restriction endonuclease subunit S [Moraxella bovoculi]AKG14084.1 hypothetical protein AAX11_08685 [Moraxella bovoculi]
MNKLKLTDREWGEFFIGGEKGLFLVTGTITTHPSKLINGGHTPRITCAATNNGLDGTYQNTPTEKGGVLTVDSATIGYVAYQHYNFIATDHVEKISLENKRISKRIGLFLTTAITNACQGKYGYGYKFSQKRIKKQIIKLPIDNQGNPDWQFMEDYIKQIEKDKIKTLLSYLNQYNALAEPSRAEPSRAEPSRAEPSRAEPSRAEPSRNSMGEI